jgi:hypothetical protein
MEERWCTAGALCQQLGWPKRRLIYELENGLPYRTIPPGWTIDWSDSYVWPYFNVEASEISIPYGVVVGAIEPPPPKKHSAMAYEKVTLGIEVLPPGAPADAGVPSPSADAPVASPASPKKVSEADVREAVLAIEADHTKQHPDAPAPDEVALHKAVEKYLGVEVPRERVMNVRDEWAPQFRRRVGRPRKDEQ